MGHRHNRRRTRPRSRSQRMLLQNPTAVNSITSIASVFPVTGPSCTCRSPQTTYCEPVPVSSKSSSAARISRVSPVPVALAPTWHYGYTGWQNRESTPPLEAGGLEAAQCRLFGGEPGDDVNLCYSMLEYFGGLDYIESASDNALGD